MNEIKEESEEVTASDDDNSRDLELSSAEEGQKYNSEAWQWKVNGIYSTYSNIHHPTQKQTTVGRYQQQPVPREVLLKHHT